MRHCEEGVFSHRHQCRRLRHSVVFCPQQEFENEILEQACLTCVTVKPEVCFPRLVPLCVSSPFYFSPQSSFCSCFPLLRLSFLACRVVWLQVAEFQCTSCHASSRTSYPNSCVFFVPLYVMSRRVVPCLVVSFLSHVHPFPFPFLSRLTSERRVRRADQGAPGAGER